MPGKSLILTAETTTTTTATTVESVIKKRLIYLFRISTEPSKQYIKQQLNKKRVCSEQQHEQNRSLLDSSKRQTRAVKIRSQPSVPTRDGRSAVRTRVQTRSLLEQLNNKRELLLSSLRRPVNESHSTS